MSGTPHRRDARDSLPSKARRLRAEGLKMREIAARLGVSAATVARLLKRGAGE